jgi:hypothetical protein
MIETNWSYEFQHLILATALRGDLLRQNPLDPELFRGNAKGPKPPTQQIAEILVTFYESYDRPPALDEFRQLVTEASSGPERREALADSIALVLTAELPEDPTFIRDRVKQQLELRRFEQAMLQTAPMLDNPDQLEAAREIMAKAMEPIGRDDTTRTVILTGARSTGRKEIIPGLVVENDTTSIYGHGNSTKSLTALLVGCVVHPGERIARLPSPLRPTRQTPVAYLDWETDAETVNDRLGRLAAGLGIEPPPILYRRMTRPLVEVATGLAADFRRRGIGLVVIDSMMYALGGGDDRNGGMVDQVIKFFNACRLFAPAARLVLNHITAQEAAGKVGTARPFGGAFAHNGPRLTWRATRDQNSTDAAITFVCTKGNNLDRVPEPFGLQYSPGDGGAILVEALRLSDVAPETIEGASTPTRIQIALREMEPQTEDALVVVTGAKKPTVNRNLTRLTREGKLIRSDDEKPTYMRGEGWQ